MLSITDEFAAIFESPPEFVVRAPGRVNLIGEHTDYNDGFVFPAAINYNVTIAGSRRADRTVEAHSLVYRESSRFNLDDISASDTAPWSNYVRAVASILSSEEYPVFGADLAIAGDVPIGSGLSSSAALEVAACLALETAGGFQIEPVRRALLCQRAEREFVGVNVGIMDQMISCLGREHHALFIDTRTLEFEAVPLPDTAIALVVADSNKRRGLVDSEYNARRAECEEAVRILQKWIPGIRALRDVSPEDLAAHAAAMPEVVRKRARHVVTENRRVLESVAALKSGDIARFGRLMDESHRSLRDDYEVTVPELDILVEEARKVAGVLGSRMTGAGFGGCTISLVPVEAVGRFTAQVGAAYREQTGLDAAFHVCRASAGASRVL